MASAPELIEDLQKELICSICLDYFTNPMSIECGHSFCHGCLSRFWQVASTPFSCPECRTVSQLRDFKANVRLGKLAAIAKKLRPHCFQYPEKYGKCEVHQKVRTLFCENDKSPVCVSCSRSKEHEGHKLYCIEKAAMNCREKLQETMTNLWRKAENIVEQMASEKIKFAFIKEEIEIQKRSILSEFRKMKQFLNEDKNAYLSRVQTQGMANLEGLNKRINGLYRQDQELRKRITELEEERKKPNVDLLQDMKGVLSRNVFVLQKEIETFHVYMSTPPIPGVMKWIFNFKVNITLDCNTAAPGLIISEDLKSVKYGGVQKEASDHSWRLIGFAQVLGTQSFISGRYYWEVEVPNNTLWCVGICKKSKESQDFFVLRTVQIYKSHYLYATAQHSLYSQVHVQYRQISEPNLKVGIFLDYEHGEISFYHVKKRYLIYTFPITSFSGPVTPLFCLSKKVLANDCSLTICP